MKESMNTWRTANEQAASLRVLMPEAVWQKVMAYVNVCDYEINGFGYVKQLDESSVLVEDVFILRQTVSPGSAVTEPDEVASHITQMIQEGKDTSSLRFQWHSHVHMQAYFSGTDTGTIDTYANCDWMISLVVNKREEFAVRLDMYQPFRFTVPTTFKVLANTDDELIETCRQEVKEKVKLRTYPLPNFRRYDQRKTGQRVHAKKGAFDEESGELWQPARDFRPF
jgi:hypothetical protein